MGDAPIKAKELSENGLRRIQNASIHGIITSPEFIRLNEDLSMLADYTDAEAVLSSLNMHFTMVSAILTRKLINNQIDMKFKDCFVPINDCFLDNAKRYFSPQSGNNPA